MADHNDTGKIGEEMALCFLRENGYDIREVNWRYKRDEIDIIAKHEGMLVVVEGKTIRSDVFGEPEDKVTRKKQRNIVRAADVYVKDRNIDLEVRFDVVS